MARLTQQFAPSSIPERKVNCSPTGSDGNPHIRSVAAGIVVQAGEWDQFIESLSGEPPIAATKGWFHFSSSPSN